MKTLRKSTDALKILTTDVVGKRQTIKVTDSFYMELSHKYENEKEELKKKIFNLKIQLDELNKKVFHKEMFLSAIEKFMEMKTITAPLIRELIDHIEVHETARRRKIQNATNCDILPICRLYRNT